MNVSLNNFSANAVEVIDVAPYLHFRPVTDYLNIVSNSDCKYFGFYDYSKHSSLDVYYSNTQFLYIPDDSSIVSSYIDDTTNTYHLELSTDTMLYYCNYSNTCKNDEWSYSSGASFTLSNSRSKSVRYIEYDLTERVIKAYNNNHSVVYTSQILFAEVESNLPNVPLSSELNVTFTPTLSGSIDRKIEQNGVVAESDYFSMTITNNSSKGYQFLMAILPDGQSVNFDMNDSMLNGAFGYDISQKNGVFYFICKEWNICPDVTGGVHDSLRYCKKQFTNTSWHYLGKNSTFNRSFSWKQINLTRDTDYNVLVYAVPNSWEISSRKFKYSDTDYYIDTSKISLVYSSTFSLSNPAIYDPNNSDFGNTPNNSNSNLLDLFWQSDGYEDSETGETIISNKSYMDYQGHGSHNVLEEFSDYDEWVSNIKNKNDKFSLDDLDFSLDSLKDILSQSTSFFNFLGTVFSFFPSFFWSLILFGLTSIIIVGIVKAIL